MEEKQASVTKSNSIVLFWKRLFSTFIDTICDEKGKGSSKRVSMFCVLILIITPGSWVYFYTFHICAIRAAGYKLSTDLAQNLNCFVSDNKIVQSVVDQFDPIMWSFILFFCLISGLASLPWIYKFICAFKGKFDVKDDNPATTSLDNAPIN